jgi:hypothetical protein
MRSPGICGDFVFAPARVSSCLLIHFEQDKISKPFFVQSPRRAETGNAASHDYNRVLHELLRRGKNASIAQLMTHLKRVVHE